MENDTKRPAEDVAAMLERAIVANRGQEQFNAELEMDECGRVPASWPEMEGVYHDEKERHLKEALRRIQNGIELGPLYTAVVEEVLKARTLGSTARGVSE